MKPIADFISEKLNEKYISQKDFADYIAVSQPTVSLWIKNHATSIPSICIPRICDILGISPYELLDIPEPTQKQAIVDASDDEAQFLLSLRALDWEGRIKVYNTAVEESRRIAYKAQQP